MLSMLKKGMKVTNGMKGTKGMSRVKGLNGMKGRKEGNIFAIWNFVIGHFLYLRQWKISMICLWLSSVASYICVLFCVRKSAQTQVVLLKIQKL